MSKYYKLTVVASGGEFTYGVVQDQVDKDLILSKIDDESLELENYGEDGEELLHFNYTQLVQNYGPDIDSCVINLESYSDEDCENDEEEIYYKEDADNIPVNFFSISNPYADEDFIANYNEDDLFFGGFKEEKRIHLPATIKLEDDETFEISNVYIGSVNMDETISSNEIAAEVLYIREEEGKVLLKEYLGDDMTDEDTIQDFFSEIYSETITEEPHKFDKFILDIGDIEGKGETESLFVTVSSMDGEQLFDREYY